MCHRVTSREASTTLVSPPRRSPEPAVGGRVIKFMATIHVPHLVQIYEYPLPDATEELPRLPTAHSSADFHSGRKGVARAQCWWMEAPRVWSGEGEGRRGPSRRVERMWSAVEQEERCVCIVCRSDQWLPWWGYITATPTPAWQSPHPLHPLPRPPLPLPLLPALSTTSASRRV